MHIIRIYKHDNGGHDNQVSSVDFPVPEGWAIVPEEVGTPETMENYPFGDLTVEDRDGVPTVTNWTPLPVPEPEPGPEPEPTETELLRTGQARLQAQVALLEEQNTFLEDCLLEMADEVYA